MTPTTTALFNSADLVVVLRAVKYENSGVSALFDEGDWDQDGDFDSSDLVLAFQLAHYEAAATPLPSQITAVVDLMFASDDEDGTKPRVFSP